MKSILLLTLGIGLLTLMSCTQKLQLSTFQNTGSPLIKDKFTADPAPFVHKGTLYLYVEHDEFYEEQDTAGGGKGFNITEWLCYSTAENSFNIHPGIAKFNGKWNLFYHNAVLTLDGHTGAIGRRSVCVNELHYNDDETMKTVVQTKKRVSKISGIDVQHVGSECFNPFGRNGNIFETEKKSPKEVAFSDFICTLAMPDEDYKR